MSRFEFENKAPYTETWADPEAGIRPAYGAEPDRRSSTTILNGEQNVAPVDTTPTPTDKEKEKLESDNAKVKKAEDIGEVEEVDGVWGKRQEGEPNYNNVGW